MGRIISNQTVDNFKINDQTIIFHSITEEPFDVYGFYSFDGFKRIPTEVAEKCSDDGVEQPSILFFHKSTSGGRIRFRTNSDIIAIKVKLPALYMNSTRTQLMTMGFDVYVDRGKGEKFCANLNPPVDVEFGYERMISIGEGEKEVTINYPLYNDVSEVFIGLRKAASIKKHRKYKIEKPVVFAGSSITQGADASRPGLSYESIISRELDINYINLGFAGAFRAQPELIDYIAKLDMSAFVLDYDHNAPNAEWLEKTHYDIYKKIRSSNPNIPIILVTRPDFRFDNFECAKRRAVVMISYAKGIKSGDHKLYFVDGAAFFIGEDRDDCTVDGCHPNDLGLRRMATSIGETLKNAFNF